MIRGMDCKKEAERRIGIGRYSGLPPMTHQKNTRPFQPYILRLPVLCLLNYITFPITHSASRCGDALPPFGSSVMANAWLWSICFISSMPLPFL